MIEIIAAAILLFVDYSINRMLGGDMIGFLIIATGIVIVIVSIHFLRKADESGIK